MDSKPDNRLADAMGRRYGIDAPDLSPATTEGEPEAATTSLSAAEAVAADRARRTAIVALPEAQGVFRRLADHLCDHTEMSVEKARATLLASAKCVGTGTRPTLRLAH